MYLCAMFNLRNIFGNLFNHYSDYKLKRRNIPFLETSTNEISLVDEYERHDNFTGKDEVIQVIKRKKGWFEV